MGRAWQVRWGRRHASRTGRPGGLITPQFVSIAQRRAKARQVSQIRGTANVGRYVGVLWKKATVVFCRSNMDSAFYTVRRPAKKAEAVYKPEETVTEPACHAAGQKYSTVPPVHARQNARGSSCTCDAGKRVTVNCAAAR